MQQPSRTVSNLVSKNSPDAMDVLENILQRLKFLPLEQVHLKELSFCAEKMRPLHVRN